jgi:uncharacterized protein
LEMVKKMQRNMINKITEGIKNREAAIRVQQKSFDLVMAEFSWKKFQNDFVKVYAEVFTEKELQAMVKFYRSELGQTIVKKMPLLQQKLMPIIQKKVMQLMPKLKKEIDKMVAEEKAKAAGAEKKVLIKKKQINTDQ